MKQIRIEPPPGENWGEWKPAPPGTNPGDVIINRMAPPNDDLYEVWGVKNDGRMKLLLRHNPQTILNAFEKTDDPQIQKVATFYRDVWKKQGLIS